MPLKTLRWRVPARLLPWVILLMYPAYRMTAQPATPVAIKPMFGVGDNEFFKSAWVKIKPGDVTRDHTWILNHMGELWLVMQGHG